MLQCEHGQHGGVPGSADGHGIPGRKDLRDLDQPITAHPRLLRIATVVRLAQSPAVGEHTVPDCDAGIGRCLDDAGKVDARDQRKLANDGDRPLSAIASL